MGKSIKVNFIRIAWSVFNGAFSLIYLNVQCLAVNTFKCLATRGSHSMYILLGCLVVFTIRVSGCQTLSGCLGVFTNGVSVCETLSGCLVSLLFECLCVFTIGVCVCLYYWSVCV